MGGLLSVDDDITDDVALGQSENAMNTVELYWSQMNSALNTQATTDSSSSPSLGASNERDLVEFSKQSPTF